MDCDDFCTLRKEVIRTGEGVWYRMSLENGEAAVVRLHRVNVVAGTAGPALQVVRRGSERDVIEVPLARIREFKMLTANELAG